MTAETNPFRNRLADSEAGNDQALFRCLATILMARPACCAAVLSAINHTT